MTISSNQEKWSELIIAVLSMSLLVYVSFRAWLVPFYSDEATTFLFYIQPGSFQPFYAHLDANNHVLNSAFAHISYLLFGPSSLAIRLPNVLGFGVLLLSIWNTRTYFKNKLNWIALFTSICLTHYLLDFFSISRGYGLSFGLLLGSVAFSLSYLKSQRVVDFTCALAIASLSTWSNLAIMGTAVAIGLVLALFAILEKLKGAIETKHFIGLLIIGIGVFVLPHVYAISYSLELKQGGMLYLGETAGFYNVVVRSLLVELVGENQFGVAALQILLFGFIVMSLWSVKKWKTDNSALFVNGIFWLSVTSIVLTHHLLEVNYPVERAAAHLIILFALAFFLNLQWSPRLLSTGVSTILIATTAVSFSQLANLSHTQHWYVENIPNCMQDYIWSWENENGRKPIVALHGLQQKALALHNLCGNHQTPLQDEIGLHSPSADLSLTYPWVETPTNFDTVFYDSNTTLALLKNSSLINWKPIVNKGQNLSFGTKAEHTTIIEVNLDSLQNHSAILVELEATVQSDFHPLNYSITSKTMHGTEQTHVANTNLTLSSPDVREAQKVRLTQLLEPLNQNSDKLIIFLWNLDQKKIEMTDVQISVSTN